MPDNTCYDGQGVKVDCNANQTGSAGDEIGDDGPGQDAYGSKGTDEDAPPSENAPEAPWQNNDPTDSGDGIQEPDVSVEYDNYRSIGSFEVQSSDLTVDPMFSAEYGMPEPGPNPAPTPPAEKKATQTTDSNCFLNMISGAKKVGRDYDPQAHNGRHAVSPIMADKNSTPTSSGGDVLSLPVMTTGRIVRWGAGDDLIYYADVRLQSGWTIRIIDMVSVSQSITSKLKPKTNYSTGVPVPSIIGLASQNSMMGLGKFASESGMGIHVIAIRPGQYDNWLTEHAKGDKNREKLENMIVDPLGKESPVGCPNYTDPIISQGGR